LTVFIVMQAVPGYALRANSAGENTKVETVLVEAMGVGAVITDSEAAAAGTVAQAGLFCDYQFLRQAVREYELPVGTDMIMSLIYTPSVGKIAKDIADDKPGYDSYEFIPFNEARGVYLKTNSDSQVIFGSNCTAVLGLGNRGPKAMDPVSIGKLILVKSFAGIDMDIVMADCQLLWNGYKMEERRYKDAIKAYDEGQQPQAKEEISSAMKRMGAIASESADSIVNSIMEQARIFKEKKNMLPVVMLEDIAGPACFEAERRLNEAGIPAIHDDQHGTAIVLAAAVINVLKKAGKAPQTAKIVINGAGASAHCVAKLLKMMGAGDIIMYDTQGAIFQGREFLTPDKQELADITNKDRFKGGIKDALKGSDIFILLSENRFFVGREKELLENMNERSAVFALANPDPEFDCEEILRLQRSGVLKNIFVVGAGRFGLSSDIVKVNNCFGFPGIFRALVDAVKAGKIKGGFTSQQLCKIDLAAAYALAGVDEARILPQIFTESGYNGLITQAVARAVYTAVTNEEPPPEYKTMADDLKTLHIRLHNTLPVDVKEKLFLLERPAKAPDAGSPAKAIGSGTENGQKEENRVIEEVQHWV